MPLLNQSTSARILVQAKTRCLSRRGSYSNQIHILTRKPILRLEHHKLYLIAKGWRSRNLVCKSTTQFGWRHQIYRSVEVNRRKLETVGRTFTTCGLPCPSSNVKSYGVQSRKMWPVMKSEIILFRRSLILPCINLHLSEEFL